MRTPVFLGLLAAGGWLLNRTLNPAPRTPTYEPRDVDGRRWLIRHGSGFYDVLGAPGGPVLVRVQTDTNRALYSAKTSDATQAIADLGISR